MPMTGLFYLPATTPEASPVQDIIHRLSTRYNPSPLPPWSLSHRLFRETPSPHTNTAHQSSPTLNGVEKTRPSGTRFLQVLSASHHAPKSYVAITTTTAPSQTRAGTTASSNISADIASGEPATIISIPSGQRSEEFAQLVISKMGPLWQQRHMVHVSNGHAFEVGDFRLRVGEVKQGIGAASQVGRGALCEIEWAGEDESNDDWESAEGVIKGFWEELGCTGARECFWVPGLTEGDGSVRQWCEILRTRS